MVEYVYHVNENDQIVGASWNDDNKTYTESLNNY